MASDSLMGSAWNALHYACSPDSDGRIRNRGAGLSIENIICL